MVTPSRVIPVVAAVIVDGDRYLVTCRPKGVHLEDHWEFPGGKLESGESHGAALAREIREELGADVEVGPLVFTTRHDYPDRTVELFFYRCRLLGEPRPMLGQQMQWVAADALITLPFPPADEELIRMLAETAAG